MPLANLCIFLAIYKLIRNDRILGRGEGLDIYIACGTGFKIIFKWSELSECDSLFIELEDGEVRILLEIIYLPSGNIINEVIENNYSWQS